MICEKCGKNNQSNAVKCSGCGEPLPKVTGCTGFADILSFDVSAAPSAETNTQVIEKNDMVGEQEMQRMNKKLDKIYLTTQKNTLFGLIAIGVSALVLILTIVFGSITIAKLSKVQAEPVDDSKDIKTEQAVTEDKDETEEPKTTDEPEETDNPVENEDVTLTVAAFKTEVDDYIKEFEKDLDNFDKNAREDFQNDINLIASKYNDPDAPKNLKDAVAEVKAAVSDDETLRKEEGKYKKTFDTIKANIVAAFED